jgi:hypothetical protein
MLKKSLRNPSIAFVAFVLFMIGYLLFLDEEGAFNAFFTFGPDPSIKFLGMLLDTWHKVIMVYIIAFTSSLLHSYYESVTRSFINMQLRNPAYTKQLNVSKNWTKLMIATEPVLDWAMTIVQFFITMTMQFQFLVPQLLGKVIVALPLDFSTIEENKFIK